MAGAYLRLYTRMILFAVMHVNSVRHCIDWLVVPLFTGDSGENDVERFQVPWNHKAGYDIIAETVSPYPRLPGLDDPE